jgi:hypothetical protein
VKWSLLAWWSVQAKKKKKVEAFFLVSPTETKSKQVRGTRGSIELYPTVPHPLFSKLVGGNPESGPPDFFFGKKPDTDIEAER